MCPGGEDGWEVVLEEERLGGCGFFLPMRVCLLTIFVITPLTTCAPSTEPMSARAANFLCIFVVGSFGTLICCVLSGRVVRGYVRVGGGPCGIGSGSPGRNMR